MKWWIFPWLLFLLCLAVVGGSYLLWRRRHPDVGAATPTPSDRSARSAQAARSATPPVDLEDYR
jgi:uncharacterized iron-regulated membrane protein